jgi:hypothetical protein
LDTDDKTKPITQSKKLGATRMLNQLVYTDFFCAPRSITAIVDHCNHEFDADFKASELSGVLLTLIKQNRLKRERSDQDHRFEYIRP